MSDVALRLFGKSSTAFADNDDIVPSVDVRSQTLHVADKKSGIVLAVFQFALAGHKRLFILVPKACVPRLSVDDVEEMTRDATVEAQEASGCHRVVAAPLPPRFLPHGSLFSLDAFL